MLDVRKQNQEGFLKRPKYWTFVFDWVPFLSLVVLFYLQNQSIPMVYDDLPFGYMVCIPDELAPAGADIHYPIQKVSQIFQSQIYQYFHYNGRVFIHFFVQFFCGILGKNVFNIVTTIVFALLLYILPQLSFRKLASRWSILPLIMLLLCLHQPTCLVQGIAHSINYLWSLTIILSFIFLINSIIENNGCSFVKLFIVSVIGFFAGWAHEGLSLAISASFVAVVSDSIYKTRTISKSIIPILSFWLGTCGVVLAPGNFIRMDTMHRSALDSITLLWDNIGFQSLFLMGLFYMTAKITKQTIKNLLIENYFWLISLLIGILLPIFSGAIYSRAFFAFDISLLMLVCNLISHYKNECVVWMFRCSFLFIPLFGYFCFLQTQALDQFKSVEKQMSLGNVEIIKPEISIPDWAYLYVYHINTIPIYSPYYEDWLKNDFQMKVFRWYYQHPLILLMKIC